MPAIEQMDDERTDDEPTDDDLPAVAIWVATRWRTLLFGAAFGFLCLGIGIYAATPKLPPTDGVDAGFIADMMYHHDQAIRMSLAVVGRTDDPSISSFAQEVIVDQAWDQGRMSQLTEEWKLPQSESDPDRTAMKWMGMATKVSEMPGIQPEAKVKALSTLTGRELDKQWLTMMRDHHEGGIHMADYEAEHGSDPILRELATTMAKNQRSEIMDYDNALKRLGLS